jgi:flavin reductase (DIM6/NTAB) family NADH-FMN oxidoreductase RutF
MPKIELSHALDHFQENWPGQYDYFSWMEFVAAAPQPLFLITTYKKHDVPNACFHSWGFWTGSRDGYLCFLSLSTGGHTYQNIERNKAFCVNYPSAVYREQCFHTIELRDAKIDEITGAGFTVEPGRAVHAPRIAECFLNLECEYLWKKDLFPGHVLIAGRAVNLAIDEQAGNMDARERFEAFPLMYNVHEPLLIHSGKCQPSLIGRLKLIED